MVSIHDQVRAKRVYEVTPAQGHFELRLADRIVELPAKEFDMYQKVAAWLPSIRGLTELSRELGLDEAKVPKLVDTLEKAGLLYRTEAAPASMSGLEFHAKFSSVLGSWLSE